MNVPERRKAGNAHGIGLHRLSENNGNMLENVALIYGEMRALKRNADGVTPLTLSKKELQIMIYFMENARQILSKEQILEYVWDVDGQFVDDNTVPVNISRLKGKIGNDYIQNVRGMGYIWTEESVQE